MKFYMKTKKILCLLILSIISYTLFAQNIDYDTLSKKAKAYESKKLYASALCTYWDAWIFASSTQPEKASEAKNEFWKLGTTILDGNPGYGEFDDFTLYDDWVLLLKDFEQYWTENPPLGIQFDTLKKGNIDRTNRTISYSLIASYGYCPKVMDVCGILERGLQKVLRDDWDGISIAWPHISVYQNEVIKDGKYSRDGVLLFRVPYDWGASQDWDVNDRIAPATLSMGTTSGGYNGVLAFEFQIALVDEQGNIIARNTSYERHDDSWDNRDGYYDIFIFDGITPEVMKIIDSGKVDIVITKATVKYGKTTVNKADYLKEDWSKLQIKEYDAGSIYINKTP